MLTGRDKRFAPFNLIFIRHMIKSLIAILLIGVISFYYVDIEGESAFLSVVFPVITFLSVLALGFWFVALFHKLGINQSASAIGGDSGGFGGCDGGGGDGGC